MNSEQSLSLTSSTLRDGETTPESMVFGGMGCNGDNQSPDLQWSGAPAATKSFAVTMWDPDAPTTVGFSHWILFDIPAEVTSLEADAGSHRRARVKATHGRNDFGDTHYDGPCPPPGDPPHAYHVTVYALDTDELGIPAGSSYAMLRFAMRQHILAQATLSGRYGR